MSENCHTATVYVGNETVEFICNFFGNSKSNITIYLINRFNKEKFPISKQVAYNFFKYFRGNAITVILEDLVKENNIIGFCGSIFENEEKGIEFTTRDHISCNYRTYNRIIDSCNKVVKKYDEIKNEKHKCTCPTFDVVNFGCKCGGI